MTGHNRIPTKSSVLLRRALIALVSLAFIVLFIVGLILDLASDLG